MVVLLALKFGLCLLAGLANSGMDTLKDHMSVSRFRFWNAKFWDPKISWARKYNLPKWVPDAFSDGWHVFKWVMLALLFAGVALPSGFQKWYWNSIFCWTAFYAGFVLGYQGIWLKK